MDIDRTTHVVEELCRTTFLVAYYGRCAYLEIKQRRQRPRRPGRTSSPGTSPELQDLANVENGIPGDRKPGDPAAAKAPGARPEHHSTTARASPEASARTSDEERGGKELRQAKRVTVEVVFDDGSKARREERGANVPMALLAALLRFLAFEE